MNANTKSKDHIYIRVGNQKFSVSNKMMNKTKYYGGVEGGATHSNLVICDDTGEIVGRANGPGTNHWALGFEECVNRILLMLNNAKENAGIPRNMPLNALALTLSGCEQKSSNEELAALVIEKDKNSALEVFVESDTSGSLFTGAPNGGMVLIAGTGSNSVLGDADGVRFGCGGWGHILSDEGGAFWIAHRAVKTVFDHVDGLKPCPHSIDTVWKEIMDYFDIESRPDLLSHVYQHFEKSRFAGLTARLSRLAYEGDPLSLQLFHDTGRALASYIVALSRHTEEKKMRVVCVGSVWKSWDILKPGLLMELAEKLKMELEFVRLKVSSAMGAAFLAARRINYDLPRDDEAYCEVFYTFYDAEEKLQAAIMNDNFNEPTSVVNGSVNGKLNGLLANGINSLCGNMC